MVLPSILSHASRVQRRNHKTKGNDQIPGAMEEIAKESSPTEEIRPEKHESGHHNAGAGEEKKGRFWE